MRLRTLFFIAAILFLVGGLALRLHPYFQQPIDELSVPLLELSVEQVKTISIENKEGELLLTRENDQWLATNGQWSNPIEKERIQSLLNPLKRVSSLGIMAQTLENWQLQMKGKLPEMSWIRLYSPNRLLESFYIAQSPLADSLNPPITYLRMVDSEVIYRIPAEVGRRWLKPFEEYREQQLLALDLERIEGLTIWQDSTVQQLIRQDSIWQDSQGLSWTDQDIQSWLRRLSDLKGVHYADRYNEVENVSSPFYALDFHLSNEERIRLEVFADSNQVDFPFVIRSNQFSGRYFRSDSIQFKQLMIK